MDLFEFSKTHPVVSTSLYLVKNSVVLYLEISKRYQFMFKNYKTASFLHNKMSIHHSLWIKRHTPVAADCQRSLGFAVAAKLHKFREIKTLVFLMTILSVSRFTFHITSITAHRRDRHRNNHRRAFPLFTPSRCFLDASSTFFMSTTSRRRQRSSTTTFSIKSQSGSYIPDPSPPDKVR